MWQWQVLEREDICLEKDKLESKMNQRFLAEEVGEMGCVERKESDGLMIVQVCCGSPIRINSVFGRIKDEVVR